MRVIFLDIDGVLNSEEWDRYVQSFTYGARFNSCYLLSQEMILRLQNVVFQTNAEIVLTSSWRTNERAMCALTRQLSLYHLSIRDSTVSYAYGNRADEVKLWIKSHSNITSYAIIDDYDDGFTQDEVLSTHFVQTAYAYGLTHEKAAEMIEILSK
jgi:hypothetical protein